MCRNRYRGEKIRLVGRIGYFFPEELVIMGVATYSVV